MVVLEGPGLEGPGLEEPGPEGPGPEGLDSEFAARPVAGAADGAPAANPATASRPKRTRVKTRPIARRTLHRGADRVIAEGYWSCK